MHHLYLSARHTVHYLPAQPPLILKGPFGSLLSRREPLNPSGLSADSDSPLAPSAQHGLRAKPVGINTVQLSGKWCSIVTPSHVGCLQDCGQASTPAWPYCSC